MAPFTLLATPRFLLRPLKPEDATETYSEWYDDTGVTQHIVAARVAHDVPSLCLSVRERAGRDDVLLLGIFTPDGATHIGNIKYEPVDECAGLAVMGILTDEPVWRFFQAN